MMKKMMFASNIDLAKRRKNFAIHSENEDKQCKTRVEKSFTYLVDTSKSVRPKLKDPVVFIRKSFDSKKGIEGFSFHVKGFFYITHNDVMMRVLFHHTLDIEIDWKIKDFSPKKSASLT